MFSPLKNIYFYVSGDLPKIQFKGDVDGEILIKKYDPSTLDAEFAYSDSPFLRGPRVLKLRDEYKQSVRKSGFLYLLLFLFLLRRLLLSCKFCFNSFPL